MVGYITSLFLLLVSLNSAAQVVEGTVIDEETKSAIAGVKIVNKKSGYSVSSDRNGHFSISAVPGETLVFTHMSYEPAFEKVTAGNEGRSILVLMSPMSHRLEQVVISGRTKYQRDSAARHELYGHELAKPLVPKPKYTGLGCAGCFGWMADKITGNSKRPKRFKKQFAADDEQLFIDSRYNIELVELLTGMSEPDSAAGFIRHYPMQYQFARAASDLELKAWIRYNYREYKVLATLGKN